MLTFVGCVDERRQPRALLRLCPTSEIDDVWHAFMVMAPATYRRFCLHFLGYELDHDDGMSTAQLRASRQVGGRPAETLAASIRALIAHHGPSLAGLSVLGAAVGVVVWLSHGCQLVDLGSSWLLWMTAAAL